MKIIKYNIKYAIDGEFVSGTECTMPYSEETIAIAEQEAFDGVEVFDDGKPEPEETPTQLDIIEAQVAYTAMITDTFLGV